MIMKKKVGKIMKKRRILNFVVIMALILSLMPNNIVRAGEEENTQIVEAISVDANGNFDGNPDAVMYWRVNEAGKLESSDVDNYNLKFEKTESDSILTMRNLQFICAPEGWESDAVFSEVALTIVVEGENSITATVGNALTVLGDLTITGSGSLTLNATADELGNEGETYIPSAMYVKGSFKNTATVICNSKNPDCTVNIECTVDQIANTGTVSVGEDQKICTMDAICDQLVKPVSYNSMNDYPVPTDHDYVAKAYYFNEDITYPNQIYKNNNGDTSEWTYIGKYDEDGNAIGSYVCYQYWYVDSRGGILTEDIVNPVVYLVYDDEPEALLQEKDIAAVADGKAHTFNTDLYALWFTNGNVTVNGDVIQDLACFNTAAVEDADTDEYQNYVWEDGERVWWHWSTEDSSVTVNGNVGLISLNDSYIGDVTVNGNIDLLGFYEDLDPSITTTISEVPATYYASKTNAGKIVDQGEFVDVEEIVEGYLGYSTYNTETFYVMTNKTLNGTEFQGTVAAVGEDVVTVDVSKDAVGEMTFPCVTETDEETKEYVESQLTDKDSKLLVMDISLIEDNARFVEPTSETTLNIKNLTGFENPALYHIKNDGTIEKLYAHDGEDTFDGTITCTTKSFSTYFVAENQDLVGEKQDSVKDKTDKVTNESTDDKNAKTSKEMEKETNKKVESTSKAPKTGDATVAPFAVILMLAGVGLMLAGVYNKKKYRK